MNIHGEFNIKIVNHIIEITMIGAWNVECAIAAIEQFKINAQQLFPDQWVCLVILDNWQLATPDAEPLILEFQEWCLRNNQVIEATVLGDEFKNAKQYQMEHYLSNIESIIEQKYFMTKNEALTWLKVKGFDYK